VSKKAPGFADGVWHPDATVGTFRARPSDRIVKYFRKLNPHRRQFRAMVLTRIYRNVARASPVHARAIIDENSKILCPHKGVKERTWETTLNASSQELAKGAVLHLSTGIIPAPDACLNLRLQKIASVMFGASEDQEHAQVKQRIVYRDGFQHTPVRVSLGLPVKK
jgi:hypothetical protein